MDPLIVGVKFSRIGKIYHFDARNIPDIKPGDRIIVETSRSWQLGEVTHFISQEESNQPGSWKLIERKATPVDLLIHRDWQNKENEIVQVCQNKVTEMKLQGVKIVDAEYSYDGTRLTILYCSETEEKVDHNNLRQFLQKKYQSTKIDIRQIGPRDFAKIIGGLGACGLEKRCCSKFLTEFSSISIRMAKEQNVSLTPSEITGMCGRLRCCLCYEYEQYTSARKKFPTKAKKVLTPLGIGKIVEIFPLKETALIDVEEIGFHEFSSEEVKEYSGK